jgi:DNA-binding GntR family transcriptional regulator
MPNDSLTLDRPDAPLKTPVLGRTRAEELREKIEELIATGLLSPGTRLDETELAERFGVSRTPIREALIQLASVGILRMRPRRGVIVPEVAPQRLVEMFEVMAELEGMCGRLAARRMSPAEHETLVQAHRACETARSSEDPDAYYFQNEIFHAVIYAGSHNSFLIEQALALHRRLRPHRRLQLRVRDRVAISFSEHARVVEALLAGDAEGAAECLRAHVLVQGQRFADLMAMLRPVT